MPYPFLNSLLQPDDEGCGMVEIEQETVSQLHALIIHNDCIINAFLWLQKPFITHFRLMFMHAGKCQETRRNALRGFIQDFLLGGGKE